MADITYDNGASFANSGGDVSFSFTVGTNPDTILLLALAMPSTLTTSPSSVEYGGVTMPIFLENAGPIDDFGLLIVYVLFNPPTGANNVTFTTGFDSTIITHSIYSYYNVGSIDTSVMTQGSYSGDSFGASLTSTVNNALIWGVGAGRTNGVGGPPTVSGLPNNFTGESVAEVIGAGDFGVQATPISKTVGVGSASATGEAIISLLSLAPFPPPATTTPGSFLLNML